MEIANFRKQKRFIDVPVGECFAYNGSVFMRLRNNDPLLLCTGDDPAAVNLFTGGLIELPANTEVQPFKARLEVHD